MPAPTPSTQPTAKSCYFCQHGLDGIDYKDVHLMRRFVSSYFKIMPRKRTGTCLLHQHKLSEGIKRARNMAMIPFIPKR